MIFALIWYFFLTPSDQGGISHSLTPSSTYPHEVATPTLGLRYYVNDKTLDQMKKKSS